MYGVVFFENFFFQNAQLPMQNMQLKPIELLPPDTATNRGGDNSTMQPDF